MRAWQRLSRCLGMNWEYREATPCIFNVLRTDSTLGGLSAERETAQREFRANAFFISYSGRFADGCRFRDEAGTAEP